MKRKCDICKVDISDTHANRKKCKECLRKYGGIGRGLTEAQEQFVRQHAGTMRVVDLAKKVGKSKSRLYAWAKLKKVNIHTGVGYGSALINEVIDYYAKHGKAKTAEKYPQVKVRSIVERHTKQLRQSRWAGEELLELARMGPFVPRKHQLRYFNRRFAGPGAIQHAWRRIFSTKPMHVAGMAHWIAREYVLRSTPVYALPLAGAAEQKSKLSRTIVLWVDVADNLKPDVPAHIAEAIRAMAKFQDWLHGGDARLNIQRYLRGEL